MFKPTEFGLLLKEKRRAINLNQNDLAEVIGKTGQYISNIEKGKNNAPPKQEDIELLIHKLSLDETEAQRFRCAAAADRNRLPKAQMEYILSHKSLLDLLEYGTSHKVSDNQWKTLLNSISGGK